MFGIFPEGDPVNVEGELVSQASVVIDDFIEMINIPLDYWSLNEYKICWLRSLEDGLATKKQATLVVSMYEPESINFLFTWVLYFQDRKVFVQNKVLFLDECEGFTVARINDYVGPHFAYNEDGVKISEWVTDLDSVVCFYNTLKMGIN